MDFEFEWRNLRCTLNWMDRHTHHQPSTIRTLIELNHILCVLQLERNRNKHMCVYCVRIVTLLGIHNSPKLVESSDKCAPFSLAQMNIKTMLTTIDETSFQHFNTFSQLNRRNCINNFTLYNTQFSMLIIDS